MRLSFGCGLALVKFKLKGVRCNDPEVQEDVMRGGKFGAVGVQPEMNQEDLNRWIVIGECGRIGLVGTKVCQLGRIQWNLMKEAHQWRRGAAFFVMERESTSYWNFPLETEGNPFNLVLALLRVSPTANIWWIMNDILIADVILCFEFLVVVAVVVAAAAAAFWLSRKGIE